MNNTVKLGRCGERIAAEFLGAHGLVLLDSNWRAGRLGELDLVFKDGTSIIFVEVKTRRSDSASEAVDYRKLAQLQRLAQLWLQRHTWGHTYRIDMVCVTIAPRLGRILWHQGIDR